MKHTLYKNFIMVYVIIGIVAFLITSVGGSYLVENHLKELVASSLNKGAQTIAEEKFHQKKVDWTNEESIQIYLDSISAALDADIWIIDEKDQIIITSGPDGASDAPDVLKNFNPDPQSSDSYCTGIFDDYFSKTYLSVLAPVNEGKDGYVAIHYPTADIYQRRSNIQEIMMVIVTIVYGLTLIPLFIYKKYVDKPMHQIARGSSEYANGNLSYNIPVDSDDELGYLAQTLNYMAERLNQSGEYQRQFISNVSHDFRSPLTSIRGYINAMLDGTIPVEMQERYLKIISYETERLEKLTHSLLALNAFDSTKRNIHPQRFDINDVLKTAATVFEGTCSQRRLRLELRLAGHELYVWADKEQIQQVVYNLLDNAIKFSNPNTSVLMETSEKNGRIFVSVKDHGRGVPKEELKKIWERFYKSDISRGKDRKGSGLGLAIVREIINAHDQTINVISTEGVGTEFLFTLEKSK